MSDYEFRQLLSQSKQANDRCQHLSQDKQQRNVLREDHRFVRLVCKRNKGVEHDNIAIAYLIRVVSVDHSVMNAQAYRDHNRICGDNSTPEIS